MKIPKILKYFLVSFAIMFVAALVGGFMQLQVYGISYIPAVLGYYFGSVWTLIFMIYGLYKLWRRYARKS